MKEGKLKPTEARFLAIFLDPKRGNGNATKTAILTWPERYKNYKKDEKINVRARMAGHYYVKKLGITLNDAFEALGFTIIKRAQEGLKFLKAKRNIRGQDGKTIAREIDYNLRLRAYELILRFCEKETIRHEITTPEGMEPKIRHEFDLSMLSDQELMEQARVTKLKPVEMLALYIKLRGGNADSNEDTKPVAGDPA